MATEARIETLTRKTRETNVEVTINLDGKGNHQVETGNGFLNHMVRQLASHGLFDIELTAKGDTDVGWHHLVEDVAIALGLIFRKALGDEPRGIRRMGDCFAPLDETLAYVVVDISGRPYAVVDTAMDPDTTVETLKGSLIKHFFETFALQARINLHTKVLTGEDSHHKAEALCKALARALRIAVELDPRTEGQVPSTKGPVQVQ